MFLFCFLLPVRDDLLEVVGEHLAADVDADDGVTKSPGGKREEGSFGWGVLCLGRVCSG